MKILISGSKGFIGKKLVESLRTAGHIVTGIDILDGIDITDFDNIKNIRDIDTIVHLAAITYVPASYANPYKMYKVNVNGTLNMLELCRLNNAKFIFSSSYVYGNPAYLPIDEEHNVSAFNPYCNSKLVGEALCRGYSRDFNIPVTIFRPFNIYGKGQNREFLIPSIKDQIENSNMITLRDPRPKRDFVHVDDVVEAYRLAVESDDQFLRIFNLGYGKSYSVKEIVEKIILKQKKKIQVKYTHEYRKDEVLDTIADISRVRSELKWEPKIDIDKGLEY